MASVFDAETRDRLRMLITRNIACWQLATEDELSRSSRDLWQFFDALPWEASAPQPIERGTQVGVISDLLTVREAIVWEWMNSRTHEGGLRWVASKLGIPEARAEQLLWSAERKIAKRFMDIEQQDPETGA